MKLRIIVNPRAGAGRAESKTLQLESLLSNSGLTAKVIETRAAGHASQLAKEALMDGVDVLGVVGGDGTFNEVAQAYLDEHGQPLRGPGLALLPAGTGGDLKRSFSFDDSLAAAVARLKQNNVTGLDLGCVEFQDEQGHTARRAFLNATSFGISASIARLTNSGNKRLGGKATYLLAALRAGLSYRNVSVRVCMDGQPLYAGRVLTAAICNGRYFGGGMDIAPGADPSDGQLDCVLLGDLTRLQAYTLPARIYDGAHLKMPKAMTQAGREFTIDPLVPGQKVPFESDGETPGYLPLRIRLFPNAIQMLQ